MKNMIISIGTAVAMFVALVVLTVTNTTMAKVLTTAIIVGIAVILGVFGKKLKLSNPIVIATTAIVILSGIASTFAISGQAGMTEFSKIILGFLVFLLVMLSGEKGRTTSTFAITTLFAGIYALSIEGATLGIFAPKLMRIFFGSASATFSRNALGSFFGDWISISVISAVLIFVALYAYLMAEENIVKIASGCYMVLFAYTFFMTANIASVVALFVAILVFSVATDGCVRPIISVLFSTILGFVFTMISAGTMISGVASGNILPLLCVIVAMVVFTFVDKILLAVLTEKQITNFAIKNIYLTAGITAVISVLYIVVGLNFTTTATISRGDTFERVFYVDQQNAQFYIELDDSSQIADVKIFARNDDQIATERNVQIARESGVTNNTGKYMFTVPNGTQELRINISNNVSNDIKVKNISIFQGENEQKLPLNYVLISDDLANAINGIKTNHTVNSNLDSITNSLALIMKSPIVGNGLGGYEAGAGLVSDVSTTQYATSSYLQIFVDLGVLGGIVFLALLGCIFIAIKKGRQVDGLNNIFLACFVALVIGCGFNNILASFEGMILLFALLALVAKDDQMSLFNFEYTNYVVIVPLVVFAGLFAGNIYANNVAYSGNLSLGKLEKAISFDVYESEKYMLDYIKYGASATQGSVAENNAKYVAKLKNSVDVGVHKSLIEMYVSQGEYNLAYEQIHTFIQLSPHNDTTWNTVANTYFAKIFGDENAFGNRELFGTQASDFVHKITQANANNDVNASLNTSNTNIIRNMIASKDITELGEFLALNKNYIYDSKYDIDFNLDGFGDYTVVDETNCNINDRSIDKEVNEVRIRVPYMEEGDYRITFNGISNPDVYTPVESAKYKIYNSTPVLDVNTAELRKSTGASNGYIDILVVYRSGQATSPQITIQKIN